MSTLLEDILDDLDYDKLKTASNYSAMNVGCPFDTDRFYVGDPNNEIDVTCSNTCKEMFPKMVKEKHPGCPCGFYKKSYVKHRFWLKLNERWNKPYK